MSRDAIDAIKTEAQGAVQFQAMRALLRAHKQTLTTGMKEEHFGAMRNTIGDAIERAYAIGWADRGRVERENTTKTGETDHGDERARDVA